MWMLRIIYLVSLCFFISLFFIFGTIRYTFAETTADETIRVFGGNVEIFEVDGRRAFILLPYNNAIQKPLPWVWYAPTFLIKSEPYLSYLPDPSTYKYIFHRLRSAGYAIAGIDIGESWGSPYGRSIYSAFYQTIKPKFNLQPKANLFAVSRGG